MPESDFIDPHAFTFAPFPHPLHPDEEGDSGALEIATSKIDHTEQYIVKRGNTYPELACNEFMYHKVATALGLYTQDVKLIKDSGKYHRSAAIRYVPNAQEFSLRTSSEENYRTFFAFEALYVIFNEEDSHEYYLDEQGRMFKLDNAAAFTVQQTTIMLFDGNPIGQFFIPDINAPLNAVGYDWYGIKYREFEEQRGQVAVNAYLGMIHRFAEFDEKVLCTAYTALERFYPKALSQYYDACIRIRKKACQRFMDEVGFD